MAKRRMAVLAATGSVVAVLMFAAVGCVLVSSNCMLDMSLIGTWKLVSTTIGEVTVTCPGSDAGTVFTCGADEILNLNDDGTYDESIASTVDNSGFWFAVDGRLMMDDDVDDGKPASYAYSLEGKQLVAKTLNGTLVARYERQGEACTRKPWDLVRENPSLSVTMLVDRDLVGTWRYASITFGETVVDCPGTSAIPGISCGANETVTFNDDNTFTETISNTDHSEGNWYSLRGRLFLDDPQLEDSDPSAWAYSVDGNVLTMSMWGGGYIAVLDRVEE